MKFLMLSLVIILIGCTPTPPPTAEAIKTVSDNCNKLGLSLKYYQTRNEIDMICIKP